MQEYPHTNPAGRPSFGERRRNLRKRDIVAKGVLAGQSNVIAGVEYLKSRGIEADIIARVLLRLLTHRMALREPYRDRRVIAQ